MRFWTRPDHFHQQEKSIVWTTNAHAWFALPKFLKFSFFSSSHSSSPSPSKNMNFLFLIFWNFINFLKLESSKVWISLGANFELHLQSLWLRFWLANFFCVEETVKFSLSESSSSELSSSEPSSSELSSKFIVRRRKWLDWHLDAQIELILQEDRGWLEDHCGIKINHGIGTIYLLVMVEHSVRIWWEYSVRIW